MKAEKLKIFLKKWCRPESYKLKEFESDIEDLVTKEICPCCDADDGFPLTEFQRSAIFKSIRDLKEENRVRDNRIIKIEDKAKAMTDFLNKANKD